MTEGYAAELPERGFEYLGDTVRRSGSFPREEVEAALERYFELVAEARVTGDWNAWADIFTEDAIYIEQSYGILRGREQIRAWVCTVTEGKPMDLHMDMGWNMIDNDRRVVYSPNWWAAPDGGQRYVVNPLAILCYAGDGKWCYEEDVCNVGELVRVKNALDAATVDGA